ncbi:MAG: hypothetical protein HUU49_01110 [Candidatus Buchananbacteria bacterium]|nr:hypothetical protein [Candidatus Buchananbacteria bacterium]
MTKFSNLAKKQGMKVNSRNNKAVIRLGFVNIKMLNIVLGSLVLLLTVGYLVQVNGLAAKGYQIKELEQQVSDLQEANSDLELETLSLQSMGRIKEKVTGLNMVAVGQPEYLVPTPVAVAR